MSRLIDADEMEQWMQKQNETIEQWSMHIAISNWMDEHEVDAVPVSHGKWIPFKMRKPDTDELEDHPDWTYVLDGQLPDEGQRILVNCVFKGHEAVQLDEFYTDADGCYLDSGYEIGTEVSAWMPLPEPYKADEVTE